MKVYAWNVFSVQREQARLVVAHETEGATVREALDEAERYARAWNRDAVPEWQVNSLTCAGYIRAV